MASWHLFVFGGTKIENIVFKLILNFDVVYLMAKKLFGL